MRAWRKDLSVAMLCIFNVIKLTGIIFDVAFGCGDCQMAISGARFAQIIKVYTCYDGIYVVSAIFSICNLVPFIHTYEHTIPRLGGLQWYLILELIENELYQWDLSESSYSCCMYNWI